MIYNFSFWKDLVVQTSV